MGRNVSSKGGRSLVAWLFEIGVGILFILLLALLFTSPRNWPLIIFVGLAMAFLAAVGEPYRQPPTPIPPPSPTRPPPLPAGATSPASPPIAAHPHARRSILRQAITVPFVAELQLAYRDMLGDRTERVVRTHTLSQARGQLYINGYCTLRRSPRQFRADRIEQIIDRHTGEVIDHGNIPNWLLRHAASG